MLATFPDLWLIPSDDEIAPQMSPATLFQGSAIKRGAIPLVAGPFSFPWIWIAACSKAAQTNSKRHKDSQRLNLSGNKNKARRVTLLSTASCGG